MGLRPRDQIYYLVKSVAPAPTTRRPPPVEVRSTSTIPAQVPEPGGAPLTAPTPWTPSSLRSLTTLKSCRGALTNVWH